MTTHSRPDNALGQFLRDRRTKLDPTKFAVPMSRRRTDGLRREEVAQRADISSTYYTWLEQGRGATPSAEVLDGLARALALTEAEREHLFVLAQNRPPALEESSASEVTPAVERVLAAFGDCPAFVRTAEWDVVAANATARRLFDSDPTSPGRPYNILESLFRETVERDPETARAMVAAFRAEATRAGFRPRAREIVDELSHSSDIFRTLWSALDVREVSGGVKTFSTATLGTITVEISAFGVGTSRYLTMVVLNPVTDADRERLRQINLG